MCGIVGVVMKPSNGFFKKQEDCFFQMLFADTLRGEDSTGLIGIENSSAFHIAKEASTAEWFIDQFKSDKEIKKQVQEPMFRAGKAYIGHNRKKTVGKITDDAAHPFVVDESFALVHNGTLLNPLSLTNLQKQKPETDVDSEVLAMHLQGALKEAGSNLEKTAKAVEAALGEVYGAYAVAMYNQDTHRIHLLRNNDRPLFTIEVDDAWYFMSEPLMGAWILHRNGYKYESLKTEPVGVHQLITFDLDTNKVYKEDLNPKKWLAPSKTQTQMQWPVATGGGTGIGATAKTSNSNKGKPCLDDKELKRLRKKFLGARVSFWPDDFLEKNLGKTVDEDGETEVTIMGGLEELDYWHTVLADVNLSDAGLRWSEDIGNRKWSGIVEAMSTTKAGVIQIYLSNCKPVMPSLKLESIREMKAFREGLRTKLLSELQTMYEENKHGDWPVWKITTISAELAFRASVKDVEHAAKLAAARDNGALLKQVKRDDRLVYQTDEGYIYYEAAIVFH
jgi:predicted glutamine amidotransferase